MKCGLFFDIIACNVFILSVLTYIMQLVPTNFAVKRFLDFMLRKIFVGPGNRITLQTACALGFAGFKVELRDTFAASVAAKVRVARNTVLDIDTLSTECFLTRNTYHVQRGMDAKHSLWQMSSMATSIAVVKNGATKEFDIGRSKFLALLRGTKAEKKVQKAVTMALGKAAAPARRVHFSETLRRRLERFRLDIPLGWATSRGLKRMENLAGKVQPRISASYFKLLFNAWPTARRIRTLRGGKRASKCLFCQNGRDSIEHFARCEFCSVVFSKFRVQSGTLLQFMALDSGAAESCVLVAKAKALHVIFILRSLLFHSPKNACAASPHELLNAVLGTQLTARGSTQ